MLFEADTLKLLNLGLCIIKRLLHLSQILTQFIEALCAGINLNIIKALYFNVYLPST